MNAQQADAEVRRISGPGWASSRRTGGCRSLRLRVRTWDIPAEAREKLLSHGLPQAVEPDAYLGVGAAFQEGEPPDYGSDEGRCYVLAVCGDVRVVAREGSGEVLAVPEQREMIPQLAHLHPGGVPDQVINALRLALALAVACSDGTGRGRRRGRGRGMEGGA